MSKELLEAILETSDKGERVALATLVRGVGSTPRHTPAKMVVHANGSTQGSIGGGSLEFHVVKDALECLLKGESRLIDYNLNGKGSDNLGLCGGTNSVFIDIFPSSTLESTQLIRKVIHSLESGMKVSLATVVRLENSIQSQLGAKMLIRADGSVSGAIGGKELASAVAREAQQAFTDDYSRRLGYVVEEGRAVRLTASRRAAVEVFIDVFLPKPTLLILGAGHIGQALTKLGRLLDMHVVVVDDRPDYANADRLPEANEIVLVSYDAEKETLDRIPVMISSATYVVVATWGWDEPALRQIVGSPAAYIGLVASSRKAAVIFEDLRQAGVDEAALAQVNVPAGLDLGAESPAEIAVSISSEILMIRRQCSGRRLKEHREKSFATL